MGTTIFQNILFCALQKRESTALKWQERKDDRIFIVDETVFYCIRAPKEIFEMYRYLLKVSDACNWSCEQQGTIPQSTR